MGIINIIKSLTKDVFKEGASEMVKQAPALAKDGVKAVKGMIAARQPKDVAIDITEPEEKVIYEEDFSHEEKAPEIFVSESRLGDEVFELTRRVNALAGELQEEKDKNDALNSEINILKGKVSEYFGLINVMSQKLSKLEDENKKQSAQLGAVNEKIRLINKRIPSKVITWIAFGTSILALAVIIAEFFI